MDCSIDIRYLIENEDLFEPGKVDEICGLIKEREVKENIIKIGREILKFMIFCSRS